MGVDTNADIYFYSGTVDGNQPWMNASPKFVWTTSNYIRTPTKTPIYDLRGKEDQFNIDVNGFEIMNYNGKIHDTFGDKSDEQKCLYGEITSLLKNRLGADHVVVFHHIIRSRGTPHTVDQCDENHKNPVFYPHVDNDPVSAKLKIKEVLGKDEATKLMKNRFQIVNVWKPLGSNPIINTPLSICDYQTLDLKKDIHLADAQASTITTSIYTISKNINDQQKWYYLRNMKSSEMFVFKMFDSDNNRAQFGAHTAFVDESVPRNNLEQLSIEMRCLVFYNR